MVSLLVSSLPVLVAIGDVLVPCVLVSSFTCVRCYGFKEHLNRYAFKSSLTDIPLVSVIRSLIITCMILSPPPFRSDSFSFLSIFCAVIFIELFPLFVSYTSQRVSIINFFLRKFGLNCGIMHIRLFNLTCIDNIFLLGSCVGSRKKKKKLSVFFLVCISN